MCSESTTDPFFNLLNVCVHFAPRNWHKQNSDLQNGHFQEEVASRLTTIVVTTTKFEASSLWFKQQQGCINGQSHRQKCIFFFFLITDELHWNKPSQPQTSNPESGYDLLLPGGHWGGTDLAISRTWSLPWLRATWVHEQAAPTASGMET